MMVCHECKGASRRIEDYRVHRFDTWEDLVEHRQEFHPLDFVQGVPFWMLEVKLVRDDYFWVARTIKDKEWLKWIGWS